MTGGGEFSHIDMEESNEEEATQMLFAKRRCCFCIPRFHSSNRSSSSTVGLNWWHKVRRTDDSQEGLWARGLSAVKKLREWSEIVAGPKWKTFIRRFNRNKSSGGNRQPKYQYDPLSYALNFDQGLNGNSEEEDDDYRFRNFSARYATVPISANSSMDLAKDGPNFS